MQRQVHGRGESLRVASQGRGREGSARARKSLSFCDTQGSIWRTILMGPAGVSKDNIVITDEDKARSGNSTHDTEQETPGGNGNPRQQRKAGERWFDSRLANTSSQDWPCNVQPQCTGKTQVLVPNHSELQSSSSMAHQTRGPYKRGPVDCTGSTQDASPGGHAAGRGGEAGRRNPATDSKGQQSQAELASAAETGRALSLCAAGTELR